MLLAAEREGDLQVSKRDRGSRQCQASLLPMLCQGCIFMKQTHLPSMPGPCLEEVFFHADQARHGANCSSAIAGKEAVAKALSVGGRGARSGG